MITSSSSFFGLRRLGVALSTAATLFCLSGGAHATGIIIPLFGNTRAQFDGAVAATKKVPVIALINPNEGPGSKKVSGISPQVDRIRAGKGQVAGYIDTSYGAEPLSSVKKQIDHYIVWYHANGVFLDEMSDQNKKLSYYRSIYAYAKSKHMLVVGNPGTFVPEGYINTCDILITFEDPFAHGFSTFRQAAWTAKYPVTKFGAIANATPFKLMYYFVDHAIALRYQWVFCTDSGGNDPFQRPPVYFANEVNYLVTKP